MTFSLSVQRPCNFLASLFYEIIIKKTNKICLLGVAPFPGATTGTGGRIRDVQSAGKGAHVVAGTAGYSFGNLNVPGSVQLIWLCNPFRGFYKECGF